MRVSLRLALRRLHRDESGQSLIVIVLSMVVLLGMAAFGIDTATWMVRHHQAQVVADSAALAAAHCLANPGQTGSIDLKGTVTTVPACSSSSDTTDAQTDAIDYAAANGLTITTNNVTINPTKGTVSVTAPAPSTAVFASMFGLGSTTQTAAAEAGWTAGASSTCSKAGAANCSVIYAADTNCGSGKGIQFGTQAQGGMSLNMTGAIHSEGVMAWPGSNVTVTASGLSVSGSCYSAGSTPTIDGMTATQVASETWPVDYRNSPYFTACTTTCTTVTNNSGGSAIAGVPSYCTNASTSTTGITFSNSVNGDSPIAGTVYCAIGTGTPSNPATWNGQIYIGANTSGCQNDTFIGGNIVVYGASDCFNAQVDGCVMYATGGSGSTNGGGIELYNDTLNWTGTLFAPLGTVQLGTTNSGGDSSSSSTGLIEGLDVNIINASLGLTGDGPPLGNSGSSSGGSDTLEQ
jgi:Putative Flp pilus-assembly TadE/G-like